MNREIIDVPLPFATMLNIGWTVDWGGQSAGTGTDGSEQIVLNRFPRWIGSGDMVILPEMLGHWRAIIASGQGRVNAYRLRMIDPGLWERPIRGRNFRAWRDGVYVEPRPQVPAVAAASAGSTTITVDERLAEQPIPVGAILSFEDWPFLVRARSGSGAETVLTVTMQRRAIPEGGQIDLIARGVFAASSEAMGWPLYGSGYVAQPKLEVQEWITR